MFSWEEQQKIYGFEDIYSKALDSIDETLFISLDDCVGNDKKIMGNLHRFKGRGVLVSAHNHFALFKVRSKKGAPKRIVCMNYADIHTGIASVQGWFCMPSVFDVAQYILRSFDEKISTMKLQKLCYYSQAWSLVWDKKPLFDEDIQAWITGPAVPELYYAHKGIFAIGPDDLGAGDADALTQDERETIDAVLNTYGGLSDARLSEIP